MSYQDRTNSNIPVKHTPAVLEKSLIHQVWWQYHSLPKEARKNGCNVLFNTDAGSVYPFQPSVTMSRDMLSYEPGEMKRFGLSKNRLRLLLLRWIQSQSLRKAYGVVFLTHYAAKVIQKTTGTLPRYTVIPHGVGENFRQTTIGGDWQNTPDRKISCLYVSHAELYKHQWVVVRAISELRNRGHKVSLLLVGGGAGQARKMLDKTVAETDPNGEFIQCKEFVKHDQIPQLLAKADIFIFASSCENMPVTVLEAMASGLPIACSDRGPMPEVLGDGGTYFDPEKPESIAAAVKDILTNADLRKKIINEATERAGRFNWTRCSVETFEYLKQCATGCCDSREGEVVTGERLFPAKVIRKRETAPPEDK